MASKNNSNASSSEKKDIVLGANQNKKSFMIPMIVGLAAITAVIAVFLIWRSMQPTSTNQGSPISAIVQPKPASAAAADPAESLTHQMADFQQEASRHFSINSPDGVKIRYFIVKGADGKFRAALDACEVCFPANLGYAQQGGDMVCRNCGRHFPIREVGLIHGGCNPVPLKFQEDSGRITINKSELLAGLKYFSSNQ
ncbi:MAG: DUF2318 domain-containing protein [Deltaproteobacteria bacterium]|nr:DUF2318 domain-containing protein [Deltaproteobacteria bacterium]